MRRRASDSTEDLLWEVRWEKHIGHCECVSGMVRRAQREAKGPTFSADSPLVDIPLLVPDVQGS